MQISRDQKLSFANPELIAYLNEGIQEKKKVLDFLSQYHQSISPDTSEDLLSSILIDLVCVPFEAVQHFARDTDKKPIINRLLCQTIDKFKPNEKTRQDSTAYLKEMNYGSDFDSTHSQETLISKLTSKLRNTQSKYTKLKNLLRKERDEKKKFDKSFSDKFQKSKTQYPSSISEKSGWIWIETSKPLSVREIIKSCFCNPNLEDKHCNQPGPFVREYGYLKLNT